MKSSTLPCPPQSRTECEPEFSTPPTSSHYFLQNRNRPNDNFINAEITPRVYLKYNVRNHPDDGLGCPGTWLFEQAWLHFAQQNITLNGIRGEWTFGANLATINTLTVNNQMSLEDAAIHPSVWAFQRAGGKGYKNVQILDFDGTPGKYLSVDVAYLP